MKPDTSEPEKTIIFLYRESLLKVNAKLIANLQKRVNVKRFRTQDGKSIKLGYIRALIQALQVQNAISKIMSWMPSNRSLKRSGNSAIPFYASTSLSARLSSSEQR